MADSGWSCVLRQWLYPPPAESAAAAAAERPKRLAPLELNVVAVGRRGLGKTAAIDSLFGVSAHTTNTVRHKTSLVHHDDGEAEISLCVTDGPGFEDDAAVQREVGVLVGSIKREMREHAFAARKLAHQRGPDGDVRDPRTHLVLFFVPPGQLPELDRKAIDTLLPHANVAVIAAKADTMVPDELAAYKEEVARQLDDSSARRRRRRVGLGVTVDEPYLPFGVKLDAPQSTPWTSPVFAVIGERRTYSGWRHRSVATPEDSDLPSLREQILSRAGTDHLVDQTDARFTDHFERGELRNSVLTAKASGIGAVAGTLLGMCIKQQIAARLRKEAGGGGSGGGGELVNVGGRAPAAVPEVPGAPVIASMLFGATLGATYHSIFGKLD